MNRMISVVLSLTLLFGIVAIGGNSSSDLLSSMTVKAGATSINNLSYSIHDSEVTITDCKPSESGELIIPATIEGYPVTSIGDWAFHFCARLEKVIIPDSVTNIGQHAFSECDNLVSVTIPNSVTSIGDYAFEYCSNLATISIPASVTSIGGFAFYRCCGVEIITVDTGNSIYHSASNCLIETESKTLIKGCNNSIIPADGSASIIGSYAFADCSELNSITIPYSITDIGWYAFEDCTGLTSVTISNSVVNIGNFAFKECTGLINVTIPNSVTTIGDYAFENCTGLTSITIPDSVTSIGKSPFDNCFNLESITVDNNPVYHSTNNCLIETNSKALISGCKNSIVPNDGSVISIEKNAFYGCTGITSITIPNFVTSIDEDAFYDVPNVLYNGTATGSPWGAVTINGFTEGFLIYSDSSKKELLVCSTAASGQITIPDSATSIDACAFYECEKISGITIPNSVTSIGESAFDGCASLEEIFIPSSVAYIGSGVFVNCNLLSSITVDANNPDYRSENNCLIEIKSKNLIAACKDSVVPNDGSVTSIGDYAFFGLTTLTGIVIPDSVTSIGCEAFSCCAELVSVTIPDTVVSIGDGAFRCCVGISNITIPNGVTKILPFTFVGCEGLTSIVIPKSVTTVYCTSFVGCSNLTDIFYLGSETEWKKITFTEYYFEEELLKASIHFLGNEPAHEHYYIGEVTKEPTCKELGIKTFTCDCGDSYTESISKLAHTPQTITIPATCTENGASYQICSECGEPLSEVTVILTSGHQYNAFVTKKPTCKEAGVKTFACKCGDSYTEPISKLAHTPQTITIPATCTENGSSYQICSECREPLGEVTVIPANGHQYNAVVTKETTCKETGVKTFTCKCGDTYTETIAKLAHTPGDWETVKEPTEVEKGRSVIKCTACYEVLEEKELPMLEVIKDDNTGIELVVNPDNYEGDVELSVEETFDGAAFNIVNTQTGVIEQKVYDVKVIVDGKETQPNGKIKVKIPLPEGYNPAKTFVYHVNTVTGKLEKMSAVYENGYMVFETDHFSYYAIVEENPTANVKLNVKSSQTVDYKANVTITAYASNVPDGYILALYDGSTKIASGDNVKISKNIGTMTNSKVFTVKVIDPNSNDSVQKDNNGNDLAANCEVNVKSGFFDKLIAFFKGLFGSLPSVEIKP